MLFRSAGRPDLRHLLGPSDRDGRHLCQRLQPVRPHVAGEDPGRGERAPEGRRYFPGAAAFLERRSGAAAGRGRRAAGDRSRLSDPLQQSAFGHHAGCAGAGLLDRPGDCRECRGQCDHGSGGVTRQLQGRRPRARRARRPPGARRSSRHAAPRVPPAAPGSARAIAYSAPRSFPPPGSASGSSSART